MAPSPPSFDHLTSAVDPEREPYAASPIQVRICRNGRMKYRRTHAPAADEEIVMPDGEIVRENWHGNGARKPRRLIGAVRSPGTVRLRVPGSEPVVRNPPSPPWPGAVKTRG